jgi:hypothetical protein
MFFSPIFCWIVSSQHRKKDLAINGYLLLLESIPKKKKNLL